MKFMQEDKEAHIEVYIDILKHISIIYNESNGRIMFSPQSWVQQRMSVKNMAMPLFPVPGTSHGEVDWQRKAGRNKIMSSSNVAMRFLPSSDASSG